MRHTLLLTTTLLWAVTSSFAQVITLPEPVQTYHLDGNLHEAAGQYDGAGRGITYDSDNRGNPLSAAHLNGGNSRICLKPMTVNDNNSFTFSCLVNPLSNRQWSTFLFIGNSSANGVGMMIKKGNTQTLGDNPVMFAGYQWEVTDTSIHIPTNQWQHFVLVKNLTQYTMYLNGQQIFRVNGVINGVTDSLRLGNDQQSYNRNLTSLSALLDEVKVYDQALSPTQIQQLFASDTIQADYHTLGAIHGRVFMDLNRDCAFQQGEPALSGNHIVLNPGNHVYPIAPNGRFTAYLNTGQTYTASLLNTAFVRVDSVCTDSVRLVHTGDSVSLNYAVRGEVCAKLNVSLSASRRRRCFGNHTSVLVSNEGLGVSLPSRLKLTYPDGIFMTTSGTTTFTNPSPGIFITDVPAIGVGHSFTITVLDSVACRDSLRNQVLCQKATLVETTHCSTPSPTWDGAVLVAYTNCVIGGSRTFTVRNNGSNMADSTDYRFYANDGLVSRGKLKLAAGDSILFTISDLQSTWLLEVDQTHGSDSPVASVISGPCFVPTPGNPLRVMAALPDSGIYYAEECLVVLDSYDPNDKEVTPKGFGNNHVLEPGSRLSYKINFQNEGNIETEFISLTDTLSTALDLSTFERGAESHEGATLLQYYTRDGRAVVTYRWPVLHLVPKTQSEAASQGFVSFSVMPKANLPLGTRVDNQAFIYFDYNVAVPTPVATVTLDHAPAPTQPVTPPVVTSSKPNLAQSLHLYPNPASSSVTISGLGNAPVQAQIMDATGHVVSTQTAQSVAGEAEFSVRQLQPGYYLMRAGGHVFSLVKE